MDDQIAAMQARLALQREALQREFIAADQAMSRLKNQSELAREPRRRLRQLLDDRDHLVDDAASTRAEQYLATQVQSSTPLELVVLLYDGALRSIDGAREAMARRDIAGPPSGDLEACWRSSAELQNTLDMERGGGSPRISTGSTTDARRASLDAIVDAAGRAADRRGARVLEPLRDAWQDDRGDDRRPAPGSTVTPDELVRLIEQYRAGIEAELNLLQPARRRSSQRQRRPVTPADFAALEHAADERDRHHAEPVTIEEGLRDVRADADRAPRRSPATPAGLRRRWPRCIARRRTS